MTHNNYLLLGPEQGEKDQFIRDIKAKLSAKVKEKPEEYVYYSFDLNLIDVIALLRTPSLFSPLKIVTIHDIDAVKSKAETDLIVEYLLHPAEDSCLFLLSSQIQADKRYEKHIPKGQSKIFWELFENQKQGWIKTFFRQQGKTIDGKAADLLLDLVTNNTMDLRRECERIVLFFKDSENIQEEDIAGFLYHSKEENVFSLFGKMAEKDVNGALEILEKILQSGEAAYIQIVSGLFWQYKKLATYKLLLQNQYKAEEIWDKLAIKTKKTQRLYETAAGNYNIGELENIIVLTAQCDSSLRSVRGELHKPLLSHYVFCCMRGISDITLSLYQ